MATLQCDLVNPHHLNLFKLIPVHLGRDPTIKYACDGLLADIKLSGYVRKSRVNQHA
jgi:hypothetical protein